MRCCVIFDMDGVIIDSEPIHITCEWKVFKILGIKISEDEHHSMIGMTDRAMWTKLKSKFDLMQSVEELVELKQVLYIEFLKSLTNLRPISHIPTLISKLYKENFQIALASSSPRIQIDFILNEFDLKKYFTAIVSGDDVKRGKPDPEIFLRASELAKVSPPHCIVIEDSNNGVLAAKKAGMKCIGYRNLNSGSQDLSEVDILIDSFDQISSRTINDLIAIGNGTIPNSQLSI